MVLDRIPYICYNKLTQIRDLMKTRLVALIVLVALGVISACSPHRTCPTYMKNNATEVKEAKV
ncbi:MAG: hypothetical protein K0R51_168 [Cytophagaceae bacterium]|nr:hypothetical protein [Cytophagaceae bacterium]